MMRIIETERIPIKLWLEEIEDSAVEQAKNIANSPYSFHHTAIMPDSHFGFGVAIGTVFASKDVIIPNAVGVDIGCGMCALKTNITAITTEDLKKIMGRIRELVPVGFEHQKEAQPIDLMPEVTPDDPIIRAEYKSALTQIGTLGGGNHFIEIQAGTDGHLWIMIHSGSRNLGLKVANYYNGIAEKINPTTTELSYLMLDTPEADSYLKAMDYCVNFAFANRKLMMVNIVKAFNSIIPIEELEFINISHNYAAREKHFNEDVFVHRKGATSARLGELGIIPGSQGTKSYIVRGKGSAESFNSCSHGAGRSLSRTAARNSLNLDEEIENLNRQGIIHAIRRKQDLDEAPSAYKDIDIVMSNQEDLVDTVVALKPLAVIKG
jgi:tRNA-splicing ligase RtcB (3'-phosphate/5'-hydroxy nucleic acid ligase)